MMVGLERNLKKLCEFPSVAEESKGFPFLSSACDSYF